MIGRPIDFRLFARVSIIAENTKQPCKVQDKRMAKKVKRGGWQQNSDTL
jgi:hypothetical protein